MDQALPLPQLFESEALEPPENDITTLPMPALVCIMRHLPQKERVGSRCCYALVCQAWCDAAAAARTTFNLERCSNPQSLTLWLKKYGRLVTNIDVRSAPAVLSQLPCPLLQQLAVQQSSIFMAPGSQLADDIMAAKHLSSLHLNQVVFRDQAPDLASVLAALPNLKDIALRQLRVPAPMDGKPDPAKYKIAAYFGSQSVPLPSSEFLLLMQQLASRQAFTRLTIEGPMNPASRHKIGRDEDESGGDSSMLGRNVCWTDKALQDFRAVLQVVSSMSSLQHLELNIPEGISEDTLAHLSLQPNLKVLHLEGLECSVTLNPQGSWQHLSLCWQAPGHFFRAPGLAIGEWSKLQSLKLRSVTLVNNAADKPELLELLPQLQQLTHLVLESVLFQAPAPPALAPARMRSQICYTALLTHKKLERLEVINTCLPWQAMTALFIASEGRMHGGPSCSKGRTSLHAPVDKPQSSLKSITIKADTPSTAVDAGDIEALVKSCTSLEALHISGVHAGIRIGGFGCPDFLPALQQLPHLTSLAVSGVNDMTVWNLAQLTNLRKLRILGPSGLHDCSLSALTALQRLAELDLCICKFSGEMFKGIMERASVHSSPGEQTMWRFSSRAPPHVWEQVQAIIKQEEEPRPVLPVSCRFIARFGKPEPVMPTRPASAKTSSHAKRTATKRRPRSAALTHSPLLDFGAHLLEAPVTGLPLSDLVAGAGSTAQQPGTAKGLATGCEGPQGAQVASHALSDANEDA